VAGAATRRSEATLERYDGYSIDAEKMSEFIVFELKLARTLLQLAVTDMGYPTDTDAVARVIDHAGGALEMVRTFLPRASLPETESAYYQNELSCLEEKLQAHPLAAKNGELRRPISHRVV